MKLMLSSAAAPGLAFEGLAEGCLRRGLTGLELVVGDGHGVTAECSATALGLARRTGIEMAGVYASADDGEGLAAGIRLAARLDAPIVVSAGTLSAARLEDLFLRAVDGGARPLLLHGTDPEAVRRLRGWLDARPRGSAGLAWQLDPARADPDAVPAIIDAAGDALEYVRLRGGGPEAAAQTGLGIGACMARLTLARYAGPLVLMPSTPTSRTAWRMWLERGGGWGCGSKQGRSELVRLSTAGAGRRGAA